MGNTNLCIPSRERLEERKRGLKSGEKGGVDSETKEADEGGRAPMNEKEMMDHITELALTEARQVCLIFDGFILKC
jgi:hypothetical protein